MRSGSSRTRIYKIGRITTSGQVRDFPLPTADSCGYLQSITTGPDGALWFTEVGFDGGGWIGRITTSGQVRNFPLP